MRNELTDFDSEGGAMQPVTPAYDVDTASSAIILVYALMALSGAVVGFLVGIFI